MSKQDNNKITQYNDNNKKLTEGAVIVSTLDKVKEGRALSGGQNLRKVPLKREEK